MSAATGEREDQVRASREAQLVHLRRALPPHVLAVVLPERRPRDAGPWSFTSCTAGPVATATARRNWPSSCAGCGQARSSARNLEGRRIAVPLISRDASQHLARVRCLSRCAKASESSRKERKHRATRTSPLEPLQPVEPGLCTGKATLQGLRRLQTGQNMAQRTGVRLCVSRCPVAVCTRN